MTFVYLGTFKKKTSGPILFSFYGKDHESATFS